MSGLLTWLWLFARLLTWRHCRRTPGSTALLAGIVALGVGAFLAVRLANRAAVASFQNFTEIVAAESDAILQAPAGHLPETVLTELRDALGAAPVRILPVLESTASPPRVPGQDAIGSRMTFTMLGVDWIAIGNFVTGGPPPSGSPKPDGGAGASERAVWSVLRDPYSVLVSPELARARGLRLGDELPLIIQERVIRLRVAGILPEVAGRPRPPSQLLVMDLPALQRHADALGRLSRVEFLVDDGPGRVERVRQLGEVLQGVATLPDGSVRWRLTTPAGRRAGAETMTRAFRLNLTILSLLALVVGMYLVFQALDGAVVRRREEIAILRSLGVPPRAIRQAWLAEAALLGVIGGSIGLLVGWLGAQGAVRLVARTVNALYHSSPADAAGLHGGEAVAALMISVLACVLAGWLPARAAAATPPAQLLARAHGSPAKGRRDGLRIAIAAGLAAAGGLLCLLPPLRLEGGGRLSLAAYAAALAWVLAAGILGGCLLRVLANRLGFLSAHAVTWRLALSQLRYPSSRHRLAVAALVCAVAMTAGMAILVSSFDHTMRGWITRTFQADLYVSSDGAQSASTENRISPATWRSVAAHPAVARAQVMQAVRVELESADTMLVGCDLDFFRDHARPAWVSAPVSDAVFDSGLNAGLVLVSEAFGERFRIGVGDSIPLPTPSGLRPVTIAGVFADYGNERGSVLVDRRRFSEWFGDELASSLILLFILVQAVGGPELLVAHPGLAVFTQEHLRSEALRIFRQTFPSRMRWN